MKSLKLVLLTVFILISFQSYGQFVNESSKWYVIEGDYFDQNYQFYKYQIAGDTSINDTSYLKIHVEFDLLTINTTNGDTSSYYPNLETSRILRADSSGFYIRNDEVDELIIPFELEVGDSIPYNNFPYHLEVFEIDTIDIGNEQRKVFHLTSYKEIYEGIGTNQGIFREPWGSPGEAFGFLKCYFHDGIIYEFDDPNLPNVIPFPSCEEIIFKQINNTTSISNQTTKEDFLIYPNPFTNDFSIKFNNFISQKVTINILDLNGSIIKSYNFDHKELIRLNPNGMTKGSYILEIINDDVVHRKLIIKI